MKNLLQFTWYLIDAKNKILGRLSSKIAYILMGKHKSSYLPYLNLGDYVVVINSKKIVITGNKYKNKIYYRHSGYVGNLKSIPYFEMFKKSSEYVLKTSVKGMLPKNMLNSCMLKKLKVFSGKNHKYNSCNLVLLD